MTIREIIEQGIEGQRNTLLDLPAEVAEAIGRVFSDMEDGLTDGKASANIANDICGYVNVIPSNMEGSCTPLLITFCYDKDNFYERIMDSLDHAIKLCPNICRHIYLLTTQWDSRTVNRLEGYIGSVRQLGTAVSFIHITSKGIVKMPI